MALLLVAGMVGVATADPLPNESRVSWSGDEGLLGGDELLLFEEMPIVVSASRQAQPIHLSSIPVSVVTAEDIRYNGATCLGDLVQFLPGVDAVLYDRNRHAVGVRGLHEFFSDRTLTLVDGRIADSPLFGGSEFWKLPVALADIERIEVVRGPGGAAWGANAFNGVINIITKDPAGMTHALAETHVSGFGDAFGQYRWADRNGGLTWKLSGVLESMRSSASALERSDLHVSLNPALDPLTGVAGFDARDFRRSWKLDGEARHEVSRRTRYAFGIGHSRVAKGDFEFLGEFPADDYRIGLTRAFVKAEHDFGPSTRAHVQGFANIHREEWPGFLRADTDEYDLEAQWSHGSEASHRTTVGANARAIRIHVGRDRPTDLRFSRERRTETWAGGFLLDRWRVADRWTLEGQVRADRYSETQTDWAGRITVLTALDSRGRMILRFGTAKAFRAPLINLRDLETNKLPAGPGVFVFNVLLPEGELANEEIWSYETGLHWRMGDNRTLRIDGYYQDYRDLIGYETLSSDPVSVFRPGNLDGATAYGGEVELAQSWRRGRASAWYSYHGFETDAELQSIRAYEPAPHKAGVAIRFRPDWAWTFNLNYKYSDRAKMFAGGKDNFTPIVHRLDLTAGRKVGRHGSELLLGVQDMLLDEGDPVAALGAMTAHDLPGRHFFSRLVISF